MTRNNLSADSLSEANRYRARFSGHGKALGAAGFSSEGEAGEFLGKTGDTTVVNPHEHGYGDIRVGIEWDNLVVEKAGFFDRLFKKAARKGIDLDLGCLYEMQDGSRGAIQALGNMHGSYDQVPYIHLPYDERTGNTSGEDEIITINGAKWPAIKRLLFYVYIYDGILNWARVQPHIRIAVPGEKPFVVQPGAHKSGLSVCALAGMENVRNGIKLENHTEYFPGHAEMDRAFGFGLSWADGKKD